MDRPPQLLWFKRDLRIGDHRPLAAAAARGRVLPLYVVEPELWQQPDRSARQWAFFAESLAELRDELARLGQPLVVRVGSAVAVFRDLEAQFGIAAIHAHEETGCAWSWRRDRAVAAWCRERGIPLLETPQHGVVRRLRSRDGWARRWEAFMNEPLTPAPAALEPIPCLELGAIPSATELGLRADPCPERQRGGRRAGLAVLASFLEERGEHYRSDMSSPVTGWAGCSRLSPHLAAGTLSLREVHQRSEARRESLDGLPDAGPWRQSLRSFAGRLHWHCHFMQKLEDEPRLEFENLHPAFDGVRPALPDAARLAAWCAGETGLPFLDACMRALQASGWMNFRMRAMLVATASYHLWLPWRASGEHLARCFTDYEPGIHWSQVQMQSGTTGINTMRVYNPVKQGYDQDPQGAFVRRWVPELAAVPAEFLHEPWRWREAERVLDRRYPRPIVDHLAAARLARERLAAVRRREGYREQADAIAERHGSRRPGGKRSARGNRRKSPEQGANGTGGSRRRRG